MRLREKCRANVTGAERLDKRFRFRKAGDLHRVPADVSFPENVAQQELGIAIFFDETYCRSRQILDSTQRRRPWRRDENVAGITNQTQEAPHTGGVRFLLQEETCLIACHVDSARTESRGSIDTERKAVELNGQPFVVEIPKKLRELQRKC